MNTVRKFSLRNMFIAMIYFGVGCTLISLNIRAHNVDLFGQQSRFLILVLSIAPAVLAFYGSLHELFGRTVAGWLIGCALIAMGGIWLAALGGAFDLRYWPDITQDGLPVSLALIVGGAVILWKTILPSRKSPS
jgi:hypothetical protein